MKATHRYCNSLSNVSILTPGRFVGVNHLSITAVFVASVGCDGLARERSADRAVWLVNEVPARRVSLRRGSKEAASSSRSCAIAPFAAPRPVMAATPIEPAGCRDGPGPGGLARLQQVQQTLAGEQFVEFGQCGPEMMSGSRRRRTVASTMAIGSFGSNSANRRSTASASDPGAGHRVGGGGAGEHD
jgi:hypothetical protein